MTKRNPEFDGFSAYFAVRAETDQKGKATPPARTETMVTGQPSKIKRNFNPLRPRGRRRTPSSLAVALKQFQPTPPARTETRFGIRIQEQPFISTHSAHEDGDCMLILSGAQGVGFQPTPPARTETSRSFAPCTVGSHFNPLRPRGRRRGARLSATVIWTFQPTPPARTETISSNGAAGLIPISTHSAREDGDYQQ